MFSFLRVMVTRTWIYTYTSTKKIILYINTAFFKHNKYLLLDKNILNKFLVAEV